MRRSPAPPPRRRPPDTAPALAARLADAARTIRHEVNAALAAEPACGPWHQRMLAFRDRLRPEGGEEEFADVYAQTMTCGLFSAWLAGPTPSEPDAALAASPLFAHLLAAPSTAGVEHVRTILRSADPAALHRNFRRRQPHDDPALHFYERFLAAYDAAQRRRRGVFFTPQPVAAFIVGSIDEVLRTDFGLAGGLADTATWAAMVHRYPGLAIPPGVAADEPFVQVFDPAVGTGTFLVETIESVHRTMTAHWQAEGHSAARIAELWNAYVPTFLLPRLSGFEVLAPPLALAHLKIALALARTGYRFPVPLRLRLYLANSLEGPAGEADASSAAADALKRSAAVTVVLGNPPFSGVSANMNGWIDRLLKGRLPGADGHSYYSVDGRPLAEKKLWLQDDYVKFFRLGQHRIERAGTGVLAYVTNHAYLDNPTFRGMRRALMATFASAALVDLHGNAHREAALPEAAGDENLFDIEQGTAVALLVRPPVPLPPEVRHAGIWGDRAAKCRALETGTARTLARRTLAPQPPYYLFVPRDESRRIEYEAAYPVTALMPVYVSGFVTARDHFVVDRDAEALLERIAAFRDAGVPDEAIRARYFAGKGAAKYPPGDTRGWKLAAARRRVAADDRWQERVVQCLYRPFDVRPVYYTPWMVDWPRPEVMRHLLAGGNLGLITCRQQSQQGLEWNLVGVTRHAAESSALSNRTREIGYVFPLYLLDGDSRRANFAPGLLERLAAHFGQSSQEGSGIGMANLAPEDVLAFLYAHLHSPAYRRRYASFLQSDFPRIFLPRSAALFAELADVGRELMALHLLDTSRIPDGRSRSSISGNGETSDDGPRGAARHGPGSPPPAPFGTTALPRAEGHGPWVVAPGYPRYDGARVLVSPTRWFAPVAEAVWRCRVGAYHVAEKWLKGRRRQLEAAEIDRYRLVLAALDASVPLIDRIDTIIERHGGWPGAFDLSVWT